MSERCRWRRRKRYGTCDDELAREEDFPASLCIGKRIVVPKKELRRWISAHTKGGQG